MRALFPGCYRLTPTTSVLGAVEVIKESGLRKIYSKAHTDNWRKIAQICRVYKIRPVFILQPTPLYGLFPSGINEGGHELWKYADYLMYEAFREDTRMFSREDPAVAVYDLATMLPEANAYYDMSHVYDEENDRIAAAIASRIGGEIRDSLADLRRSADHSLGQPR